MKARFFLENLGLAELPGLAGLAGLAGGVGLAGFGSLMACLWFWLGWPWVWLGL